MPVVFVHGVATRQTDSYKAEVAQRDQLFLRLVMNGDTFVRDPDWGSNGVKLALADVWIPTPGQNQTFAFGGPAVGAGVASVAASAMKANPETGMDVAFSALLTQRIEEQTASGVVTGLSDDELNAFASAVTALETNSVDRTLYDPAASDDDFANSLRATLAKSGGVAAAAQPGQPQAMGLLGTVTGAIGSALKTITDPIRNAGSDAILKLVRKPLSEGVALFLGDVFVYLRGRDATTPQNTFRQIFEPIIADLAAALQAQTAGQKLIVVGHSLGGVILYDMLTDTKCLTEIEARAGKPLVIDHLVTVGAQPGLFANMNLYPRPFVPPAKMPQPPCVGKWMNVFDYTDVFSFTAAPFFEGVTDFEFDNVSGIIDAHTAYFQRPAFYTRLRARLAGKV